MMKSKALFVAAGIVLAIVALCSFSGNACSISSSQEEGFSKEEIIVDVRTIQEWNEDGHAPCTVNYPLDEIGNHVSELKSYKKITLVCRSGNRANQAKVQLEKAGVKNIVNLGPWQNVVCK
jgi:rhodanese-related sulfurtransferase